MGTMSRSQADPCHVRSVLTVTAAFALGGCSTLLPFLGLGPQPVPAGTVKIGFIGPRSGAQAFEGQGALQALELAAADINKGGGAGGRQVEILAADDAGSPETGVLRARQLVADGAVALVGPIFSGVVEKVLAEVAQPAGVVVISPGATAPALVKVAPGFFFRLMPADDKQGQIIANAMVADGHTKVAVLARGNAYGDQLAAAAVADFESQVPGGAKKTAYGDTDAPDYQTVRAGLDGTTAAALIGYNADAAKLINAWAASGEHKDIKWYFSEALANPQFARAVSAPDRLAAARFSSPIAWGLQTSSFVSAYLARYKTNPPITAYGAYDAGILVALAVSRADTVSPAAVREQLPRLVGGQATPEGAGAAAYASALAKVRAGERLDFAGASGPVAWDASGELLVGRYELRKFELPPPETAAPVPASPADWRTAFLPPDTSSLKLSSVSGLLGQSAGLSLLEPYRLQALRVDFKNQAYVFVNTGSAAETAYVTLKRKNMQLFSETIIVAAGESRQYAIGSDVSAHAAYVDGRKVGTCTQAECSDL